MTFSLAQIAALVGVSIPKEVEHITVKNIASIENATEVDLSFLSNLDYENFLYTSKAAAVFVPETFIPKEKVDTTLIKVASPQKALNILLSIYEKENQKSKKGIEQPSFISENAKLGKDIFVGAFSYLDEGVVISDFAKIYPNCYIGKNVKIGEGTIIRSGVKIHDHTEIGNHVEIDYGAVIGSRGFGYIKREDHSYESVPQVGKVIIHDHVYIGANATIDRATMGKTLIEQGTKIDNLVQLGHNVSIGEHTIICGQVGIAGSTKIGHRVTLAGQVGIADHLEIADGIIATAQTGINRKMLTPNIMISGSPAYPFRQDKLQLALIRRLPEFLSRIEHLEKKNT